MSRSPSSTAKCRNCKVRRRDLGSNPGPHSCVSLISVNYHFIKDQKKNNYSIIFYILLLKTIKISHPFKKQIIAFF